MIDKKTQKDLFEMGILSESDPLIDDTDTAGKLWQQVMKGASDFVEGFRDYTAITQQSEEDVADDFCVAFDEGGRGSVFPNSLLISMLTIWNEDARKQRELALDLAEKLSAAELQALYQVVVKATKLK